MSPSDVVSAFISAVESKDLDAAAALLHPDVSYENVPMDPVSGREATIGVVGAFLGDAEEVDWVTVRQLEDGHVVMNERIDRFRIGSGWLELPVAGVFEVDGDGLITLWRDFFDLATFRDRRAELKTD